MLSFRPTLKPIKLKTASSDCRKCRTTASGQSGLPTTAAALPYRSSDDIRRAHPEKIQTSQAASDAAAGPEMAISTHSVWRSPLCRFCRVTLWQNTKLSKSYRSNTIDQDYPPKSWKMENCRKGFNRQRTVPSTTKTRYKDHMTRQLGREAAKSCNGDNASRAGRWRFRRLPGCRQDMLRWMAPAHLSLACIRKSCFVRAQ